MKLVTESGVANGDSTQVAFYVGIIVRWILLLMLAVC